MGPVTDATIAAAVVHSARGHPLAVLSLLALRDDPLALALRASALAQIGELELASKLLRRATLGFGQNERVARAKCVVAEAEIALVARDLTWPGSRLERARVTLERHGDSPNAAHARHLAIRRHILIGEINEAEQALAAIDAASLPFGLRAAHALLIAQVASRQLNVEKARTALAQAGNFACQAGSQILVAETALARQALARPAAKLTRVGVEVLASLEDIATVLASDCLVIDACHGLIRRSTEIVSLKTRPMQLKLARVLGAAWPDAVSRSALISSVFGGSDADTSHRARLRVAVNRLRSAIAPVADIVATAEGFRLDPHKRRLLAVIEPPIESSDAAIVALLADGAGWSSASLAIALDTSQRTVQRGLDELVAAGEVRPIGRGRARRWTTGTRPPFTTTLLLPGADLAE